MRILWLIIGLLSVGLGVIGIFLPLLPTVPFLLLAAICFGKSSERLHHWLLNHPTLGPPIQNWQSNGAIPRRAKWLATASIIAGITFSIVIGLPAYALILQAVVLSATTLFIWTRPEG